MRVVAARPRSNASVAKAIDRLILALDSWPKWRKASVVARYIDTEYAPPMSFRGGITLAFAVSLLANTVLCALAFALGRGLVLWWS